MVMQWRRIHTSGIASFHRTGWLGVWDALKSAITQNPRLTVPKECTFSFWLKIDESCEARLDVFGQQLSIGARLPETSVILENEAPKTSYIPTTNQPYFQLTQFGSGGGGGNSSWRVNK